MLTIFCLFMGIAVAFACLAYKIFMSSEKLDNKLLLSLSPLILGYVCILGLSMNIKSMEDKIKEQHQLLYRTLSFVTSPFQVRLQLKIQNEEINHNQAFNEELDELIKELKQVLNIPQSLEERTFNGEFDEVIIPNLGEKITTEKVLNK